MRKMTSLDSGAERQHSGMGRTDEYEFIEFGAHDDLFSLTNFARNSEPRISEASGQQIDDDDSLIHKSASVTTATDTMMTRTTSISGKDTKQLHAARQ